MAEIVPFLDYLNLSLALKACVEQTTQGQEHIKPFHRHFAMRLVLEGGFLPDEIAPHPPFRHELRKGNHLLLFDETVGSNSEQTVIGGIKSKQIDVVVTKPTIGPVMALSFKATQNAFRNLTNRMEEAVGDCTNIHLRYPSLVYGFYHVILANRTIQIGQHRLVRSTNDVSVADDDSVEPQVMRYLLAIEALSGRKNQWEEPSAYEAIAVRMIESDPATAGQDFEAVSPESPLHPRNFMEKLLRIYDIRYPYMAESVLAARRVEWSPRSPLFDVIQERTGQYLENTLGYLPRYS